MIKQQHVVVNADTLPEVRRLHHVPGHCASGVCYCDTFTQLSSVFPQSVEYNPAAQTVYSDKVNFVQSWTNTQDPSSCNFVYQLTVLLEDGTDVTQSQDHVILTNGILQGKKTQQYKYKVQVRVMTSDLTRQVASTGVFEFICGCENMKHLDKVNQQMEYQTNNVIIDSTQTYSYIYKGSSYFIFPTYCRDTLVDWYPTSLQFVDGQPAPQQIDPTLLVKDAADGLNSYFTLKFGLPDNRKQEINFYLYFKYQSGTNVVQFTTNQLIASKICAYQNYPVLLANGQVMDVSGTVRDATDNTGITFNLLAPTLQQTSIIDCPAIHAAQAYQDSNIFTSVAGTPGNFDSNGYPQVFTFNFMVTDREVYSEYTFRIVSNDSSTHTLPSVSSSLVFKYALTCAATSTTITALTQPLNCIEAFCNFMVQFSPFTRLQLADFSSSNINCAVQSVEILEHPSNPGRHKHQTGVLLSTIYQTDSVGNSVQIIRPYIQFTPSNQLFEGFAFKIRVTAKGGATAEREYLDVRYVNCLMEIPVTVQTQYELFCPPNCMLTFSGFTFSKFCTITKIQMDYHPNGQLNLENIHYALSFDQSQADFTFSIQNEYEFEFKMYKLTTYFNNDLNAIRTGLFTLRLVNCNFKVYDPPPVTALPSNGVFDLIKTTQAHLIEITDQFKIPAADLRCPLFNVMNIGRVNGFTFDDFTMPNGGKPTIVSAPADSTIKIMLPLDIDPGYKVVRFRVAVRYIQFPAQDGAYSYTYPFTITILNCAALIHRIPKQSQESLWITSNQFSYIEEQQFGNDVGGPCEFSDLKLETLATGSKSDLELPNGTSIRLLTTIKDPQIIVDIPYVPQLEYIFKFRFSAKIERQQLTYFSGDFKIKIINCKNATFTSGPMLDNTKGHDFIRVISDGKPTYRYELPWQFTPNEPLCLLFQIGLASGSSKIEDILTLNQEKPVLTSNIMDKTIVVLIPQNISEVEKTFRFKISAMAFDGVLSFSNETKVKIIDCEYSIPVLNSTLDIVTQNTTKITYFPLASLFSVPYPECAIRYYRILKVTDTKNVQIENNFVDVDELGTLYLLRRNPREKALIYVQARASKLHQLWSDPSKPTATLTVQGVIEKTISDENKHAINTAPVFEQDLVPQVLSMTKDTQKFVVTLPNIVDAHGDPFTVDVGGLSSEITFENNMLTFQKPKAGIFNFTFTLKDERGKSRKEIFQVTVQPESSSAQDKSGSSGFFQLATNKTEFNFKAMLNNLKKDKSESKDNGRNPIHLNISQILPNGEIEVRFSEKLKGIDFWEQKGLDLEQINDVRLEILKVRYYTFVTFEGSKMDLVPKLVDWWVKEFQEYKMVIQANFSNPLYVSTSQQSRDQIGIDVLQNHIFRADKDNSNLAENYTVANFSVPTQAKSEEDYLLISNVGSSVQNSMLMTLLIPFCFMLFMSVSMEKVWSMYLMMQVASNMLNFTQLIVPANSQYVLMVAANISNFKLLEEPNIKQLIAEYLLKNEIVREVIVGQGIMVFGVLVVILLVIFILIGQRLLRNKQVIEKIKRKVMWSSLLRSQIQFYFPTTLATFQALSEMKQTEARKYPGVIFKCMVLLLLPLFSYRLLTKPSNFSNVNEDEFSYKWGTLYSNTDVSKPWSSQRLLTFFCLRRLLMGLTTVFLNQYPLATITLQSVLSLMLIGLHLRIRPLRMPVLNRIEVLNEFLIYISVFFSLIYTDWLPDVELRYAIGFFYAGIAGSIAAINISIVIYDMLKQIKKKVNPVCKKIKEITRRIRQAQENKPSDVAEPQVKSEQNLTQEEVEIQETTKLKAVKSKPKKRKSKRNRRKKSFSYKKTSRTGKAINPLIQFDAVENENDALAKIKQFDQQKIARENNLSVYNVMRDLKVQEFKQTQQAKQAQNNRRPGGNFIEPPSFRDKLFQNQELHEQEKSDIITQAARVEKLLDSFKLAKSATDKVELLDMMNEANEAYMKAYEKRLSELESDMKEQISTLDKGTPTYEMISKSIILKYNHEVEQLKQQKRNLLI